MEVKYFNKQVLNLVEYLKKEHRSDITKSLDVLEEFGHMTNLPHSKSLGDGLFELRCLNSGVRMFYVFSNNSAFILHAIIKKQLKIPKKDLDLAKRRRKLLA